MWKRKKAGFSSEFSEWRFLNEERYKKMKRGGRR